MKYLLDTDHISILQRRAGTAFTTLKARINQYNPTDFAVSIISFHEQLVGAHTLIIRAKSSDDILRGYRLMWDIQKGFTALSVLPFDRTTNARFEEWRGQKIQAATMDLRIAAIASSRNLVVLTRNTRDFCQVPGLKIEDWTI